MVRLIVRVDPSPWHCFKPFFVSQNFHTCLRLGRGGLPPRPLPPYGQPDRKISSFFYDFPWSSLKKLYYHPMSWNVYCVQVVIVSRTNFDHHHPTKLKIDLEVRAHYDLKLNILLNFWISLFEKWNICSQLGGWLWMGSSSVVGDTTTCNWRVRMLNIDSKHSFPSI